MSIYHTATKTYAVAPSDICLETESYYLLEHIYFCGGRVDPTSLCSISLQGAMPTMAYSLYNAEHKWQFVDFIPSVCFWSNLTHPPEWYLGCHMTHPFKGVLITPTSLSEDHVKTDCIKVSGYKSFLRGVLVLQKWFLATPPIGSLALGVLYWGR